ncbi:hypothetical protein [Streptomyces sp. NPDC048644]|uniref:hypothetical protein n=1 Tax=Streptomyces sp. NPDC048644 TaxID=3365582 RepID=UPI003716597C
MRWTETCWREVDDAPMRAGMYTRLEHIVFSSPGKDGAPEQRDWAPTKQKIGNLLDALGAVTLLPTDTDAPAWINQEETDAADGSPIVACSNGLLRIRDRALLLHGPGFFNLVSMPFAYDPQATAPIWDGLLREI